jgi:hypothetical protein
METICSGIHEGYNLGTKIKNTQGVVRMSSPTITRASMGSLRLRINHKIIKVVIYYTTNVLQHVLRNWVNIKLNHRFDVSFV